MALGALGKDLEDQGRAIGHRHTQMPLQIALLGGRQGLIEQDAVGRMDQDQFLDLIGFARAEEQRGIRCTASADDPRHRFIARRSGQQGQLFQPGVE